MSALPNLRHLRYLVALHDHLHFGRAAAACFVTQSTLSAGIRELEAQLGAQVAERSKRSVVITPLGHRLVARSRLLLREAEALVAMAAEDGNPMAGTIDLGVLPTIGPFLLPRLIPALGRQFPQLRLALREDKTGNLLDQLAEGRLDLVLMAFPYDTPGMETRMLFDDAYRFATRDDDAPRPVKGRRFDLQAQIDERNLLLLEHDHCLHSHALPALQHAAEVGRVNFSSTSLHTLVAMVSEGMGATFLPDLAITGGILKGTRVVVQPLGDAANARTIGLCWRRNAARRETFLELGRFLHTWAARHVKPWAPA
ncbi:hydrogen peroxide-inducible genes activator [Thermomonas sp.]|uniref:hydrogen peroxide-inducible genes activator n=1 Tax=Thermomonas sp. TaxID=1971895 RepID=UPI001ACCFBDC|nr:LysR family transcriptional regulator [Stenotrophomonas sp.]